MENGDSKDRHPKVHQNGPAAQYARRSDTTDPQGDQGPLGAPAEHRGRRAIRPAGPVVGGQLRVKKLAEEQLEVTAEPSMQPARRNDNKGDKTPGEATAEPSPKTPTPTWVHDPEEWLSDATVIAALSHQDRAPLGTDQLPQNVSGFVDPIRSSQWATNLKRAAEKGAEWEGDALTRALEHDESNKLERVALPMAVPLGETHTSHWVTVLVDLANKDRPKLVGYDPLFPRDQYLDDCLNLAQSIFGGKEEDTEVLPAGAQSDASSCGLWAITLSLQWLNTGSYSIHWADEVQPKREAYRQLVWNLVRNNNPTGHNRLAKKCWSSPSPPLPERTHNTGSEVHAPPKNGEGTTTVFLTIQRSKGKNAIGWSTRPNTPRGTHRTPLTGILGTKERELFSEAVMSEEVTKRLAEYCASLSATHLTFNFRGASNPRTPWYNAPTHRKETMRDTATLERNLKSFLSDTPRPPTLTFSWRKDKTPTKGSDEPAKSATTTANPSERGVLKATEISEEDATFLDEIAGELDELLVAKGFAPRCGPYRPSYIEDLAKAKYRLSHMQTARDGDSPASMEHNLTNLRGHILDLIFPRLCLSQNASKWSRKEKLRNVYHLRQLREMWEETLAAHPIEREGNNGPVPKEARQATRQQSSSEPAPVPPPTQDPDNSEEADTREKERVRENIKRHLANGNVRKAAQAVAQDPRADPTTVADALKSKYGTHPDHLPPLTWEDHDPEAPEIEFDRATLANHCRKASRGSAPGLSGFPPDWLYEFGKYDPYRGESPDEPLAKRIVQAQEQYCAARLSEARGLIHPKAIELKMMARGLAFLKPGHTPEAPSVRPIAIVESNLKHSFALSAAAAKTMLDSTMRTLNYGIATRGGMEICQTITSLYLEGDKDRAALLIDSKNAFNELPRIVMYFGLKCFAPSLVNGFVRKYGRPGRVAFDEDTVVSQERGCCQGDPCGPIYYACGLEFMKLQHRGAILGLNEEEAVKSYLGIHKHAVQHRVWEHLKYPPLPDTLRQEVEVLLQDIPTAERGRLDGDICALDYLDDLTRVGDPAALCTILKTMDLVFKHYGQTINKAKTVLFTQEKDAPPELIPEGIKVVSKHTAEADRGITCLGTPIGSPEHTINKLEQKIEELSGYAEKLVAIDGIPQQLFHILKGSFVHKPRHLMRTLPPEKTRPFAVKFQEIATRAFAQIHAMEDQFFPEAGNEAELLRAETLKEQISFPIRKGGMGILHLPRIAEAAYLQHQRVTAEFMEETLAREAKGWNPDPEGTVNAFLQSQVEDPAQESGAHEWPTLRHTRTALKTLGERARGNNPLDPLDEAPTTVADHLRELETQKGITMVITAEAIQALEDRVESLSRIGNTQANVRKEAVERMASLVSARASEAGIAFQVLPTRVSNTFSASQWVDNVAIRLNIPAPSCVALPRTCTCGLPMRGGLHLIDCRKAHCRYRTHESLKQSIGDICRRLGIAHKVEPRVSADEQDRTRLDIELYNVPGEKGQVETVGVDVTTVNPLAPSYAENAKEEGQVAQNAAERKKTKYQEEYQNKFIPFVVESTGGWAKHNHEFFSILSQHAKKRGLFFNTRAAKVMLAIAHRKEMLYAIHGARECILAAYGCPGFGRDEFWRVEASAVQERPVVDG